LNRLHLELANLPARTNLDTLLQMVLDAAERLTSSQIGFFHFVDPDQENLTLQTWSTNTLQTMCTAEGKGQHYPLSQAGVWADACRLRKSVIHNDYPSLPRKKALPPGHAPVTREMVVPVLREGKVAALLGVGNKASDYTEEDLRVAESLASTVTSLVWRARAESELRQREEQLRQAQKMEAVGQLAGGVAHDFNNILAALMLHLGLLRMSTNLDPATDQVVGELQVECQRAANLSRQLLLFGRRSVLQASPLNLNPLLTDLLKMLRRLLGDNVTVHWQERPELPLVEADAGMIEQVVMNLCINARDAMPKGGQVTIAVEPVHVSAVMAAARLERRSGDFVCLTVGDTGVGMDAATRARIFEPFFTTKEPGKGTGLGLATVHGIAAQHRGWVEVESEPGQGSTFRVFLPVATGAAPAPVESAAAVLSSGRETLLLVEDEPSVREASARCLRALGYHVLQADNGERALRLWKEVQGRVDLLVSDMLMPGEMTGLDLLKELRRSSPELRAVICSGYSSEIALHGFPSDIGVSFLPKPYTAAVLAEMVRSCLDRT
jgi:signal transduction histidine kinase/CheY-like chemotaxis protein